MLLVVFVHVEIFSFFNFSYETVLMRFISVIHMPIFFFISGLCIYKSDALYNRARIYNDILRLIIPAFIMGMLYTYLRIDMDIMFYLSNPMKAGYWFTISLFETLVIYYLIFNVSKRNSRLHDSILVVIAALLYSLKLPLKIIPQAEIIGDYLCLHQTCNYFLYFVLGVLFTKYRDRISRYISNVGISICILLILICFTFMLLSNFVENKLSGVLCQALVTIEETIVGLSGVLVLYILFSRYQTLFSDSHSIGKSLIFIGNNTLAIYLVHYFILPNLPIIGDYIKEYFGVIGELILCLPIVLAVVTVCILVSKFIRLSPFMSRILLGDK